MAQVARSTPAVLTKQERDAKRVAFKRRLKVNQQRDDKVDNASPALLPMIEHSGKGVSY